MLDTIDDDCDVAPGLPARPAVAETFQGVLRRAMDRRQLLLGAGATGAALVLTPSLAQARGTANTCDARLNFVSVEPNTLGDITTAVN